MRPHSMLALAAVFTLAGNCAQAHQIWLESANGQARLHFGEFNDNLRETSPGSLDKFTTVPALELARGDTRQTIEGTRTKDAFSYPLAGTADTLLTQAPYPVIDRSKRNQPNLLWKPAARWVARADQAIAPTAPLDLVPTGKPGQFRVVFQGAPLAKAKVQMVAPSGWAREERSADDGTVNFALPWKGQYVAEVKHSDQATGEQGGVQYAEVGYLMTLSFVQPDGMASPELGAPVHRH